MADPLVKRQQNRPSQQNAPPPKHSSHAGGIAAGIILLLLLIIIVFASFYGYRFWKARKLGLPPPSLNPFKSQTGVSTRNYPARGGVVGWTKGIFKRMQNKRTAGGAYESGRGARGFGPVDQDEGAWDPRMDRDEEEGYGGGRGYYEEQELGLTSHHARGDSDASYVGGHADTGYHAPRGLEESTPRGHARNLSDYDTNGQGAQVNPFADSAERSDLGARGRSNNDMGLQSGSQAQPSSKRGGRGDSPTSERRSVFHEEV